MNTFHSLNITLKHVKLIIYGFERIIFFCLPSFFQAVPSFVHVSLAHKQIVSLIHVHSVNFIAMRFLRPSQKWYQKHIAYVSMNISAIGLVNTVRVIKRKFSRLFRLVYPFSGSGWLQYQTHFVCKTFISCGTQ